MKEVATTVTFDVTSTPSQKANLEIRALSRDPRFRPNLVLGSATPPKIKAENIRKSEERWKSEVAIIAKHGVQDEYVAALEAEELELRRSLEVVVKKIQDIRATRE